ncbi:hypothetical protein F5884DRAFT_544543 [Xylogone sp. PMI_703]|nr:hypothetical protein F5884DRAFT_544543 [Xylogone sp. PMI_703]
MQVSAAISKNPWFERIWTCSESLMASKPLHFLVPCERLLERSHWLGNLSDQIVVHQLVIQELLCSIIKPYTPSTSKSQRPEEETIQKLLKTNRDTVAAYHIFQETCPKMKWSPTERRSSDIVEACGMLASRDGKEISDRIAIIANVCGYRKALDCQQLVRLKLGFSICTLALSIVNDDRRLIDFIQTGSAEQAQGYKALVLSQRSIRDAINSDRALTNTIMLMADSNIEWDEGISPKKLPKEGVEVVTMEEILRLIQTASKKEPSSLSRRFSEEPMGLLSR